MQVTIPKEMHPGERRVALAPQSVGKLSAARLTVSVEAGAGSEASFPDAAYAEAGAAIGTDRAELLGAADIVLMVRPPSLETDVPAMKKGAVLIALLEPLSSPDLLRQLAAREITAFSMELVPRITRAQRMDALSSQATVAGYKAVLLAANRTGRFLPMLMTAAGTIPPARVLVLGAGVAGLQAIATARRLGAVVQGFDIRPAVKEQVESLGATWVGLELAGVEGESGYATEVSEETQRHEHEHLHRLVTEADIVITTAQIPGRPAPVLITEDMVADMRRGSVIVDLAAESGGNCALTQLDGEVDVAGVRIIGPSDLASTLPFHASQMYSRNVTALLLHLVKDDAIDLDEDDEITRETLVTHAGEIVHERVRSALGAEAR